MLEFLVEKHCNPTLSRYSPFYFYYHMVPIGN